MTESLECFSAINGIAEDCVHMNLDLPRFVCFAVEIDRTMLVALDGRLMKQLTPVYI